MDAGYFGSGCYSTLSIEYAVRYAAGRFDKPGSAARPVPEDRRYPIIMFACCTSTAYPITPNADYGNVPNVPVGFCDYFGRSLKPHFDCHVICVSELSGCQAVNRKDCQYVEVVIEQEAQMLPIAVLWFEAT
jgi:hypothetical protein